jgi:hypothetical protein
MWRATRVPIRLKLAATLAVPLLALVVVGLAEVVDMAQEVSEVRGETQLARASTGPAGLITRLQDERTWATLELIGLQDSYAVPMAGYAETRDATDQARDAFRDQVESAGGAVEATYRDALASLDANSRIAPQVDDTQLRAGTYLADLASRQVELEAGISRTTVVNAMLTPNGIDERAEVIEISTPRSEYQDNNRRILRAAGPYAAIVREYFPTDLNDRLEQSRHATRWPTCRWPSPPCRSRPSTWRSSRPCCAATSPTPS